MATSPEEILQIHKMYADEFSRLATDGLSSAFHALSNSSIYKYTPTQISITSPNFGKPKDITSGLPLVPPAPFLPLEPTLLGFENPPNPDFGTVPRGDLNGRPIFQLPQVPTGGAPKFSFKPPELSFDRGLLPSSPPAFISIPPYVPVAVNIPTAPPPKDAEFNGVRPTDLDSIDANTIVQAYNNAIVSSKHEFEDSVANGAIVHTLTDRYCPGYFAIRNRLEEIIVQYTDPVDGGGSGIPINIENAIHSRNIGRVNAEYQSAVENVLEATGKKGWTIPGGAALAAMRDVRVKMGDAVVAGSVDIAVKNLELEQKQFQFMYTALVTMDEKMRDMILNFLKLEMEVNSLSIEAAKQIVATYIGVYNLQVMAYKAAWDGYVADATVFNARINALEARAKMYAEQVRGEVAKSDSNVAQANVLRSLAEVNSSLAGAYKSQVEAALAPMELQRLSISAFEAQARAFAAEVQGWEAQYRAYSAEIEGRSAEQKAYESQISVFREEINAWRSQVDAYKTRVEAVSEVNRSRSTYNEGQIKVWSGRADQAIKTYEGQLAGYKEVSNVHIKQSEIEVEYWKANASLVMQQWNVALQQTFEFAREQMNLFRGQMEAAVQAGNGLAHAASVAGNLAGGAMTGLTSFAGTLVNAQQ